MIDEAHFTLDGAYLRKQAKLVLIRYFMYFNPSFWRAFVAAKGIKAKFNCWLDWPEHNVEPN